MKDDLNIDKEVLLFRYCNDIATPAEKKQVEKLIMESRDASEELRILQHAVDIKQRIREMESYNISAGYKEVKRSIRKKDRKKRFIFTLFRVAAVLALPLLISTLTFGYIFFNKYQRDHVVYTEIVSAPGTISRIELPDKSKVWLNSNSVLRYPNRFEGLIREVELEGEGYFEVRSDKQHPFYVATTSNMKVMAYGTQFNINTEKKMVKTVLAEGKVAVFYQNRLLKELTPGEEASFNRETGKIEVENISLLEKLAWKDGKIIFRNAPLNEVFERLSKHYNIDIILHDKYNQSDNYLSRVTFTNETIQQIFSYLEIAAPIEWKISTPVQNNDSTLVKQRIDVWLRRK